MKPLTLADIPPPAVFAAARGELKKRVIAHKAARRVAVGNCASLLFEDRETLRWQVLEMCRVEGVRDNAGVQRELDIYNELLPAEGGLSATLFIEIGEPGQVRAELDRLIGLDEYVSLQIGGECIRAGFDPRQMEEDRISAVQYLRFALNPAQLRAFADPAVPLRLAISHPNYAHTAEIGSKTRASLLQDLRGGAAPLLDFAAFAPAPAPAQGQVIAERGSLRALHGSAPGHVILEVRPPAPNFPDAPAGLLAEMLAFAQEIAAGLLSRHAACRISLAAEAPLRLHLQASEQSER